MGRRWEGAVCEASSRAHLPFGLYVRRPPQGAHIMRALRIRYPIKKPHTYVCGQKKKDILSDVLCVGITYFHGPSPGNYRLRKLA